MYTYAAGANQMSPGGWLGMYVFHHKTRHWSFVLGFPALTLLEYGLLGWLLFRRFLE